MPTPHTRTATASRLLIVGSAFALSLLSCGREPTAPGGTTSGGVVRSQGLAWVAEFPAGFAQFQASGGGVAFSKVHIVLNNPDGSVALDTLVDFPPGATELPVTLSVILPASAPASGQALALNLDYQTASGASVFHGGPVTVTAVPVAPGAGPPPPSPVVIPLTYTGPGASAKSVRISPPAITVAPGAAFGFSAQALDASGAPVPNTPIVFNTSNAAIAPVNALTGGGTAGSARGTATITAQLLTGPTDAATLTVIPPPANLALVSGGGQTANVNAGLANPIVVRVTAADGIPSPGVPVSFGVATGGGSVTPTSVTTDASGQASAAWKLGGTVGAQTLTVASGSLAGSPITVGATGLAIDPVRVVIASGPPASVAAGAAFGLVVNAVDATGAITPTFTGPVSVGVSAGPGGLGGTTTVNAVAGVASFSGLALSVPGAYTLAVGSGSLIGATATVTVKPGAATKLVFQNYPVAGAAAGNDLGTVSVAALDAQGNLVTDFIGAVSLSLASAAALHTDSVAVLALPSTTAGTAGSDSTAVANVGLTGTTTANAVAGIAVFSGLRLTAVGTYAFSASSAGLAGAAGPSFPIVPGPAAGLILVSGGGQSGGGGTVLPTPITVQVTDIYANVVGGAGRTITFAVTTGGGSVSPTAPATNASGRASTTWTLGASIGAQTITASSAGLSSVAVGATSTSVGGIPGVPTQLAFTVQPATTTAGIPNAATITVAAKDAFGTVATTFTGNITLAIGTNPGGSTLSGGLVVAAVAGVANFPNVRLDKTGTGYTLGATSGALTAATSTTFNITAAAASALVMVSGDAQTGTVGTALPLPLVAKVVDAFGNAVAGTNVNLAASGGGGSISPSGVVATNASGQVSTTLTLGATPGVNTVSATSAGLTGSPLTFTATGTVLGVDELWTGAVSTAWNVAGNWSPAVVPLTTHAVQISPAANQPVLVANTTVKDVFIGTGATLNVGAFVLTVTRHLDAGNTINGTSGSVVLNGGGNLKGTINVPLTLASGTPSLNGTLTLGSSLTISAGELLFGANTVTVAGNFTTTGTGYFNMSNSSAQLTVNGNADFSGAEPTLTNGTVFLFGNFQQTAASNVKAYRAQVAHATIFSGGAAQTISLASADAVVTGTCTNSCFGNLNISKSGGTVTFNSNVAIVGNLAVNPGVTSVLAVGTSGAGNARDVRVNGVTTTGAAAGVHFTNFTANGDLSGVNAASVIDSIGYGGTAAQNTLNRSFAQITIKGAPTVAFDITVPYLVVDGGTFTPNSHTITVTSDFTTVNGGTFTGASSSDVINVNGNVSLSGGTSAPSDGRLYVKGNLTLTAGTAANFGGAHQTWFNGTTGTQTITGATPVAAQGLHHVHFIGGAAKVISGSINFSGDLYIDEDASMGGPITGVGATVGIGGIFHDPTTGIQALRAGGSAAVRSAIVARKARSRASSRANSMASFMDDGGGWQVANTTLFGNGYIDADIMTTNLTITGHAFVWRDIMVFGNVIVTTSTGKLDLDDHDGSGQGMTVSGNFSTTGGASGGRLEMNEWRAYLGVYGSATFAGGSTTGLLLDGVIEVQGDFYEGGGAATAFDAVPELETWVGIDAYCGGCIRAQAAARSRAARANANLRAPAPAAPSRRVGPRAVSPDAVGARVLDPRLRNLGRPMPRGFVPRRTRPPAIASAARAGAAQQLKARKGAAPQVRAQKAARMRARQDSVRALLASRHKFMLNLSAPRAGGTVTGNPGVTAVGGGAYDELPTPSVITLTHQGAGSQFGLLYLAGYEADLATDILVAGEFQTGYSLAHNVFSTDATPRTITSQGSDVRDLYFNNTRWVLFDGEDIGSMDNVAFDNMDQTVNQFEISAYYCDCTFYLEDWTFYTTPTTGKYIRAEALDANGIWVQMDNPRPGTHAGFITEVNVNTHIQNWPAFFEWVGLGEGSDWDDPFNWSTELVPSRYDDVIIHETGGEWDPWVPGIDADSRNLTIEDGASIYLGCGSTLNAYGNVNATLANTAVNTCEGESIYLYGDGSAFNTVRGKFDLLNVEANYKISTQVVVNWGVYIENSGNLTVNGGRLDVGDVGGVGSGSLYTYDSGTLTMQDDADLVFIGTGGSWFNGGSTTGKLTKGTMTLVNSMFDNSCVHALDPLAIANDAFAPSGTHKVVFSGPLSANGYAKAEFLHPTESFLNDAEIAAGSGMLIGSDVVVKGTLSRGTGTGGTAITTTTPFYQLTTSGLSFSAAEQTTVDGVLLRFNDGTSNAVFNNVIWTGFSGFSSGQLVSTYRTGGPYTFTSWDFSSAGFAASGAKHFLSNFLSANITLVTPLPSPVTPGQAWQTFGGTVTWP